MYECEIRISEVQEIMSLSERIWDLCCKFLSFYHGKYGYCEIISFYYVKYDNF